MDITYYESGYIDDGYYNYVADASADLTSAFTLRRDAIANGPGTNNPDIPYVDRILNFDKTTLVSAFTVSTNPQDVNGFAITMFNTCTVSATAKVTKTTTIALQATSSVSFVGKETSNVTANLICTTTVTASGTRTKQGVAAFNTAFTATAAGITPNRRPRTTTAVGSAVTSATQKILGSHSLFIPNTSSRLDLGATGDFNIASGQEFLMEFFVYPTNTQTSGTVNDLVSYTDTSGRLIWQVTAGTGSPTDNSINFNFRQGAGTGTYTSFEVKTQSGFNTNNLWYWIRVSRFAGTIYITVRLRNAGGTWSSNFNSTSFAYNGAIGGSQYGTLSIGRNLGSSTFTGYIDEFYIGEDISFVNDPQFPVNSQTPVELTNGKNTETQVLFHFNGNFTDDMTGTVTAQAALTARATATINATDISSGRGTLVSATTLVANARDIASARANLQVTGINLVAVGKILASVASLQSTSTLTAVNRRIRLGTANLQSAFTLTAPALDLDIAQANLTSTFTVNATAREISSGRAVLTSASTLACTPTRVYLQLIYNSANASGYITSTGTRASAWGTPVHVNYWISIARNLTAGEEVVVYRSGSNQVVLRYNANLPDGSGANIDGLPRYQILVFNQTKWASQNLGSQIWYQRRSSFYYGAVLPTGWDATQWHNIHMPLSMNSMTQYLDDIGVNTNIEYYTGNLIRIDGALGTPAHNLTTISAVAQEQQVAGNITPSEYTQPGVSGGQWGEETNPVDLYLDQVWVKTHARTGSTSQSKWDTIPVSDFYNAGNEVPIPGGLTSSGLQAQVWLPWGTLLDRARSTSPTWDYTAFNRVVPGLIVTGSGTWTATTTVVARPVRIYQLGAGLSTRFTQTTVGLRLKRFVVTATATSTTNAQATKLAQLRGTLTSTSTISSSPLRIKQLAAGLSTRFTQTTNTVKAVRTNAGLSTQFAQITGNSRLRDVPVSTSANASITNSASRTARAQASLTAFDTVVAATAYTGRPRMFWETTAAMTTVAKVIPLINATLTANTLATAQGQNIQFGSAGISATSSMVIEPDYLRRPQAHLTVSSTVTVNNVRVRYMTSQLAVQAQQTTNNVRTRNNIVNTLSQVTVNITNQIVRLGTANLAVKADLLCSPFKLFRGEAHLTAFNTQLSLGEILHVDPYYQLWIKPEYRALWIEPETRILTPASETRVNKIRGYNYDN